MVVGLCSTPSCSNCFALNLSPPNRHLLGIITQRQNHNAKTTLQSPSSSSISLSVHCFNSSTPRRRHQIAITHCSSRSGTDTEAPEEALDCVGTGLDVECLVSSESSSSSSSSEDETQFLNQPAFPLVTLEQVWEWAVLVSPFFFWGTAMVAMKEVLPKTGPLFVAAFRLIPAGLLLVGFAASKGRPFPSGLVAWLSIALFGLVDATCFQGFLAQGLERTSAGLGSVIIDSQPLTVAILAALLFGESIGIVGAAGLVLGVVGLLLLEVGLQERKKHGFTKPMRQIQQGLQIC